MPATDLSTRAAGRLRGLGVATAAAALTLLLGLPLAASEPPGQRALSLVLRAGDGRVEVLSHQRIRVPEFPEPVPDPRVPSPRRLQADLTLHDRNGRVVHRGVATLSALDGPEGVFAIRVPEVEDGELVFGPPLDATLSLADLPPPDESLARRARVLGRTRTGPPRNRVDLVILSEGFTAAEENLFRSVASVAEESLFAVAPHDRYRPFVNVTHLFVPSPESGTDHPPWVAGCEDDPSCCGDPDAQDDPRAGTFVDTALDGRFCARGLHRYLVVDDAKAFAAAAAVPEWDQIVVVANDPTFGASGDLTTVVSRHGSLPRVLPHEHGHTFTLLADEYETFFDWPLCSDLDGPPCEANVTDVTTRGAVKWEPWIAPSTPVPTPETSAWNGAVGVFEGARYMPEGMYRPRRADCLMNHLDRPFCEICRQETVLGYYRGGWGVPAAGIDLIEPGSEIPAQSDVRAQGPVSFSVDLVAPLGDPAPTVRWTVDGVEVPDAPGPQWTFVPPGPGSWDIALEVADPTPFVHPEMDEGELVSRREWTVTVEDDRTCETSSTALCLLGARFRVEVDWETSEGGTGPGRVAELRSADSGLFWFFGPENWELLVKVLDACRIADRFWVFYAATTNVGFELRVTDTETGETGRWQNPVGVTADAVTDTSAFDTCP